MILRDESKHRPIESSGFRRDERIRSDTALVNLAEIHLQTLLVSRLALRQSEETPLILVVSHDKHLGSVVHSLKQAFPDVQFSWFHTTAENPNQRSCYEAIVRFKTENPDWCVDRPEKHPPGPPLGDV